MPMPSPERMAQITRKVESLVRANNERDFAPAKPASTPVLWKYVGGGAEVMEIKPTPFSFRVHGICSTPTVDSHRQAVWSPGIEASLPLPLMSEHKTEGSSPIGTVYHLRRDAKGLYCRAELADHFAAEHSKRLIEDGETLAFSISVQPGQWRLQSVVDNVKFFDRWTLKEISVCRAGANPDARLEVLADDADDGSKFWLSPSRPLEPKAPELAYRGVWKSAESYQPGVFVTHRGSLWASLIESSGVTPGDSSPLCWKLAVKKGHSGNLGSDHDEAEPPPVKPKQLKKVTKVTQHDAQGRIVEFETTEVDDNGPEAE